MRGLKRGSGLHFPASAGPGRIFYRCVDWNRGFVGALYRCSVASFTDAWIETLADDRLDQMFKSHLLQMRGLKLATASGCEPHLTVASFTDAWIETCCTGCFRRCEQVASFTDAWIETRESRNIYIDIRSHLLQMRGLKLRLQARAGRQLQVASFTDAWIETTLQRRVWTCL